jgi:hypothetical protein
MLRPMIGRHEDFQLRSLLIFRQSVQDRAAKTGAVQRDALHVIVPEG